MHVWLGAFIISCFLVVYNYIGYAFPIYLWNRLRGPLQPPQPKSPEEWPAVSFIVAAFNEQDCIREKILNSLAQDYPGKKLEFIFVTDGSTDDTPRIVAAFPEIKGLYQPERNGKSAAVNRAVAAASNNILIFSDANTVLNVDAIRNLARHYLDPQVGGVAGEKKVLSTTAAAREVGEGEGLYWKYESFLKRQDSAFYSVVGAAGELFSVRSALYEPLPHHIILDDFVLSLNVAKKGYRVVYEPGACATELPSLSMADEHRRKVRIAAGGFQAISLLTPLLAFWRRPRLSYLYISHRFMRWAVSPLCLIVAYVSNCVLALGTSVAIYRWLLGAQTAFYGMAALAARFPILKEKSRLLKLGSYFVFMNVSVVQGFFRFVRGKQAAAWEKARRVQSAA
ncbi:MAG TPA: glycosyltransferase family 2 protein [Puia sp.]|nr:glycosyltransferase family 2 protein [Puia sp.]